MRRTPTTRDLGTAVSLLTVRPIALLRPGVEPFFTGGARLRIRMA